MTTTIKVSAKTRDRLKDQARAHGRTLGEHVEYLAGLGERADRMGALRSAIAQTSAAGRAAYTEETRWWEHAELTDGADG
ncbi:MAG TPA: hypothetical protein VK063_00985 [Beutenbergiaceae bacterium]|nr:hypothetical protein [Beutenbergiaceae bacterium]